MTRVGTYVSQIKEKNKEDNQDKFTVTVTLNKVSHDLLIMLSERLQTAKSNLASGLVAAAIREAADIEIAEQKAKKEAKAASAKANTPGNAPGSPTMGG